MAGEAPQVRYAALHTPAGCATPCACAALRPPCGAQPAESWTLWVKRTDVQGARYDLIKHFDPGQLVAELIARWVSDEKLDVDPSLVTLRLVKRGPGVPTASEEAQAAPLEPRLTLREADVMDGGSLLAVFAGGAGGASAAVAPASGSPPRVRFVRLLNEAKVTRPDATVLQLLERHLPAAMLAVFDAGAALELYEHGKLLPGTPTRLLVREATGVTLNGPLLGPGGEPLSNVLTGTSRAGRPLVAKLLFEPASESAEVQLCAALQLTPWDDTSAHPHFMARASAVCVQVDPADRHGVAAARRYGPLTALLMQRHPACLAELPQLSGEAIARGARQLLCALTFLHAAHGAGEAPWVHMDVKAANVLVCASGDWLLSDFGSAVRCGGAVRTCTDVFLPPPPEQPDEARPAVARTECDFDMLLVLLNIEARKSGWKEALFETGRRRVSRTRLAAATDSLLQSAAFADTPPELCTGCAECVRGIRAHSTLA
jgi:hypothetical protein